MIISIGGDIAGDGAVLTGEERVKALVLSRRSRGVLGVGRRRMPNVSVASLLERVIGGADTGVTDGFETWAVFDGLEDSFEDW